MSYNIHHGADKDENNRIEEVAEFIKRSGAHIIGLQEVDSVCTRSKGVDQMKVLSKLTGMHYAFVRHFEYQGGAYGMGILSRYPIADIENIRMTLLKSKNTSTAMIGATIEMPGNKKIKFTSAHFALDDSSRLLQARQVVDYLNKINMPLIVTGDLNATPDAKEIQYLKKYFTSTDHQDVPTYPAPTAIKKIDYIFVSKKDLTKVQQHLVPISNLSDHLPVVATLVLK